MIEKNSYLDMYHVVMLRNHFIAVKLCTSCKMRVFFQIYVAVDNSLVDMYDKCGLLAEATRVFKSCLVKDVVSWTSIITGYAEHGYGDETCKSFTDMWYRGIQPNAFNFVGMFKVYASNTKAI